MDYKTVLAISTLSLASMSAQAAFDGAFGLSNWAISEDGDLLIPTDVDTLGSVDISAAPYLLTINSPDCASDCTGPGYEFAFTVASPEDGFISFEWDFDTEDSAYSDRLGVWKNGDFFQLVDSSGASFQSGSAGIAVASGDIFGFGLKSFDSCCGASVSRISSFSFTSSGPFNPEPTEVMLPTTAWLFGTALVSLAGVGRTRFS